MGSGERAGKRTSFNGATGASDMAGATAEVAVETSGSERDTNAREHMGQCGQRASFSNFGLSGGPRLPFLITRHDE
jgi:hypothetical protein